MKTTVKRVNKRLLILSLLLVFACLTMFSGCKKKEVETGTETTTNARTGNGLVMDTNAEEGGLEYASPEEIQEELNRKVEEGMINISMNTSPVFENGTAKGNLLIVNSEINRYPQIVYIVRNDTNEEIYRSGGIAVGSKIEYAALDVDLDPGVYECTAYFNNADPETGDILGTAGAEITITVQG